MVNLYNKDSDITMNQDVYDNFNSFIFSGDRNIFFKLMSKFFFCKQTEDLIGDIVECGVFKGTGMLSWLKLVDMLYPNSLTKVIGFDYFNSDFIDKLENDIDKKMMKQVFDRCKTIKTNNDKLDKNSIKNKILNAGFNESKFELVEGDISETSKIYSKRPGFRIKILYMDLDLDEATYATLENLWDKIVPGGYIIFDEYAYHNWSETIAVDNFIKNYNLELISTNLSSPTAYIIK